MCGILFTNFIINDIDKIIKFLKNRGPDYTGDEVYKGHHFIHVLLSMTGMNYTYQPFIYKEKDIVILFNGEIYNYKEFGDFNSDGECIIKSYEKYGDKFIQNLEGEFAIVLCDFKKKLLYYSTDIFSIKPLWIGYSGTKYGISSYESPLKLLGFDTIYQIPPNKTYKCHLDSFKIISELPVYTFDLKQFKTTYDDWNTAFEEAVLKRCRGIKHGVFIGLSSGYDSGAIACVLNKFKQKYHAYSIIGSENPDVINKRLELANNKTLIELTKDEFVTQYKYLLYNCEKYNLFIDNDEKKFLDEYQTKLDNIPKIIGNKAEINLLQKKIKQYKKALDKAKNKKLVEDNGSIGLGCICQRARQKNELIYLTGSGADEIHSDYGWNGIKHYRHSTIGGLFPNDLSKVFPWRNFFGNTQRAYLMKEEYVSGTYGIEGRYPFLDKQLVQEFLWLTSDLKNKNYKAPIYNYLSKHNYPFDENKKMGFNCGFSYVHHNKDKINKQIATRTKIGETKDKSLIVSKK